MFPHFCNVHDTHHNRNTTYCWQCSWQSLVLQVPETCSPMTRPSCTCCTVASFECSGWLKRWWCSISLYHWYLWLLSCTGEPCPQAAMWYAQPGSRGAPLWPLKVAEPLRIHKENQLVFFFPPTVLKGRSESFVVIVDFFTSTNIYWSL